MPIQITRRDALAGLAAGFALPFASTARATPIAKIGPREIISISDGQVTLPAGMIARDRSPDELAKVLRDNGLAADVNRMPLNVTVLREGSEYTLIDCGAGGRFLEGSGKLANALEAAGIDKAKVTRVLFTHAHADHFWGAVDEFDEPLFPNARFSMPAAERDFWTASDVLQKVPEAFHMMAAGAQRIIKQLDDKLETFTAGGEVAPGIASIDTGGHTQGHVSFEIRGGGQTFVVLGDALTHPVISFAYPEWMPASDQDGERAVATRKKLLDRLASEKLQMIGYHLPGTGAGRVERKDSTYRFVSA
jgi:glyoxylase-like metal-dependent hydrolase (beta-lactamase superfamily II)